MVFTSKKMLPKDWQKIVEELLIHQQSSNVRSTQHDQYLSKLIAGLNNNENYQKQCIVEDQIAKAAKTQIVAKVKVNGAYTYYYDRTTGFWYPPQAVEGKGVPLSPEIFDCGNISTNTSGNRDGKCFIDKSNTHLAKKYSLAAGMKEHCVAMGCKHRSMGSLQQQTLSRTEF
jgi:hypothetical protein